MVTGELSYFFIREVALALHQQAAQHHPALLPLFGAALLHEFVQCGAGVVHRLRYAHSLARHIVLYCKAA